MVTKEQKKLALEYWHSSPIRHTSCLCRYPEGSVSPLQGSDRFDLKLRTGCCLACGTIRSLNAHTDYTDLYSSGLYRKLHPGTLSLEERIQWDIRKGEYLCNTPLWNEENVRNVCEIGASTGYTVKTIADNLAWSFTAHDLYPETDLVTSSMPTGYYDILIANHVLEHCLDPVQTLEKWSNHLLPQGTMYVSVPNFLDVRNYRLVQESGEIRDWLCFDHIWNWTPSTITLPFLLAGLRILHNYVVPAGVLATIESLVVVAQINAAAQEFQNV